MARVTCRCGEKLKVPADAPERIECPKCGAKIRLRRPSPSEEMDVAGDGYVRFHCPCGRRLKVPTKERPAAGKCPDCGRVVPVPETARSSSKPGSKSIPGDPEALDRGNGRQRPGLPGKMGRAASGQFGSPPQPGLEDDLPVPTLPGADPVDDTAFINPAPAPNSAVKFEAGIAHLPPLQEAHPPGRLHLPLMRHDRPSPVSKSRRFTAESHRGSSLHSSTLN